MHIRTKAIVIILSVLLLAGGVIIITLSEKVAPTNDLQAYKKTDKTPSTPSVEKSDSSNIYNSNRNSKSIVKIPPEPDYRQNNVPAPIALTPPKALIEAIEKIQENDSESQVADLWESFLQGEPTHERLQEFLSSLDTPQLFELMEYTSGSDTLFASSFMANAIIPELKGRWAQEGDHWEDYVPYDQLLQIAMDKQKPDLFRKVMIDLLSASKRMTVEEKAAVLGQMSQGLAAIVKDTENASDTRAYAIGDLGLISQELHGEESPYSELFLRLAQDNEEDMSVRVKSIQMLPLLEDYRVIPVLEDSCMNYQPKDNVEMTKAAVVALSDYAQKSDIQPLEPISNVMVVTSDSKVFSASVYAISRLDEESFVAALPTIITEKKRFKNDSLVDDSIYAALWRQPDAVINAINSDDAEMIQAGIEAACYVPLPPVKKRLDELLTTSPPDQQDLIRRALKRAEDVEAYEMIIDQISKEGEGHNDDPNKTTD